MPTAQRTATVHVLVNEQADGAVVVHPVTAARFAAYAGEEEAATELGLFLREYMKRSPPAAKSRLSLPAGAALLEVQAPLPRDERRREPEIPVTFPCVAVPARAPEPGATLPPVTSPEHDDVWVLVPVLDHALYVERGEDLVETVRAEIRRLLAALDPSAWELVGLFPPARARLEALDIPLPDGARGSDAEAQHQRLAERARRKQARSALRAVATPLSEELRRAPHLPLTGRDAELGSLRSLLDGKERLGVLLVGPEHAGKSALARAYAAESGRAVWATSGAQLIAGMSGLGQWQERVRDVMEAVRELDAVLYFESLDDLLAERVESGGVDLAGAMRPYLDGAQIRVLAEIRGDRLDAAESRHWAFFAGLSRLRVTPLSADVTLLALERRAAEDARRGEGRPVLAEDALRPLVDLADRYLPYGAFPGKAMRLYEDLTAAHERHASNANERTVIGRRELYHLFSLMTGVPDFLLRDDAPLRIEDVAAALRKQVIGQEAAIARLAETIGVVKAGLQPRGKPLATFLFIGPTGVGKTELARALSQLLFGSPDRAGLDGPGAGQERLIRFDMSEFMTPDAAERLIRGTESADGLLTRRVREQPFCVLLLDEIEKAHPAVFDLLLQVCGEGRLTDARGRTAYFQNAILIMTSNLGAADRRAPAGFTSSAAPDGSGDLAHYQRLVAASFRAEFVGRLDRIVPFRALSRAEIREVTRLGVARLALRSGLAEASCTLGVSPAALTKLADEGYSETYGARAQRRHLDEHLAGPLARLLAGLGGEAKELDLEVTLPEEPALGDGAEIARAREGGLDLVARRRRRAQRAEDLHDHAAVAALRRHVDETMTLGSVEQLRDHLDYLVTQLNLTDKEKADRRVAREMAELSADHHRIEELWGRLLAAQEEVHAMEELAILALFEGQDVGLIGAEAERAHLAFLRVLPYALVALEPRRDAATLMIEELDEGALEPWLTPLLHDLPRRGWSALAHVHGAEKLLGEDWPEDRPWGPPRTPEWLLRFLAEGGKCRNLLLRVKGAYAGAFLALEAGLHRTLPAKKPEAVELPGEEGRGQHVGVRVVALQFDVPDDAWKAKHLEAPPVGSAHHRRRAPVARLFDEPAGAVRVWRMEVPGLDPAAYWSRLEEAALLMLLDFERGARDRDAYFAPPVEDDD